MSEIAIAFIGVAVCLVIVGVCIVILVNRHNKKVAAHNYAIDRQLRVNNAVLEKLKDGEFNITKIYYVADASTFDMDKSYNKMVAVDDKAKKICLVDYQTGESYIIGFNAFISCEVYENGGSTTFTSAIGSTIGNVGGGIASSETVNVSKDLSVTIRIKNYEKPQVTYHIIASDGVNKSTALYKICRNSLQELISFFEIVKLENSQG